MFNKFWLGIVLISLLHSCVSNGSKKSGSSGVANTQGQEKNSCIPNVYLSDNGDLTMSNIQDVTKIEFSYLDMPFYEYRGTLPVNLKVLLGNDSAHRNDIALYLCDKDFIPIVVRTNGNYCDTVYYKYKKREFFHLYGQLESGKACS